MARNPRNPQNGQNVHGFQVRTPICHIVPVSRAYGYMVGGGGIPCFFFFSFRGFPLFFLRVFLFFSRDFGGSVGITRFFLSLPCFFNCVFPSFPGCLGVREG